MPGPLAAVGPIVACLVLFTIGLILARATPGLLESLLFILVELVMIAGLLVYAPPPGVNWRARLNRDGRPAS
jgi:uncharacterized membrane protein